jgi:hypothetical protein
MILFAKVAAASVLLLVATSRPARSQSGTALPLSVQDTSYALRLAINELQDLIQTGERPRTLVFDHGFDDASRMLRQARAARNRARPTAHANSLWDFQIDVEDVRPAGPNRWVSYVTITLGQDSVSSPHMALLFDCTESGWRLTDKKDVLALLATMVRHVNSGGTP